MGKFTDVQRSQSEFYETIPFSGEHYIYRDDTPATSSPITDGQSDRAFAIMTLVLIIIVAAAAGLLLAWGISTLQSTQAASTLLFP